MRFCWNGADWAFLTNLQDHSHLGASVPRNMSSNYFSINTCVFRTDWSIQKIQAREFFSGFVFRSIGLFSAHTYLTVKLEICELLLWRSKFTKCAPHKSSRSFSFRAHSHSGYEFETCFDPNIQCQYSPNDHEIQRRRYTCLGRIMKMRPL